MPAIEMLADPNYSMVITAGVAAVAFVSAATFVRSSQAAKKRKKEEEGKARRASATLKLRFVAWVQTAVAAEESNALDTLEVHLDTENVELDVLEAKTRETTHRAEKKEKRMSTIRRSHAEETRALMEDVRLGEILQGRLGGQLEAERDVREIRKKRFKGDVATAKEKAKTSELTLATISGLLKIEQENVNNLKAENERRQAEVRSRVATLQLVPPSLQRPPDSGMHVNPEEELEGSEGVEELLLASPAAIADTMAAATGAGSTFALDGEETSSIAAVAGAGSSAEASENGLEEFGSGSEWDEEIDDEHQQEEREQTQQQQQQQQQRELVDQMSVQREGEEQEQGREQEQMSTQQEEEKEQKRKRRRHRRRLRQEQQYKRDLKLMFLRNVAETSRELSVSVPAMHLARWCSLRPSSRALRRGQVLNEGAFGTVTVVQHETHGSFALKEVSTDAAKEVGWAAMQEVHILIDLMGHDNIIGLKGFDLTIRSMPILMELATCDAFDVLEGGYFYSVLQKARIMRDGVCGLIHIHRFDLVHVDFKPENLLVAKTGRERRGKVTDFGLSRSRGTMRPSMTGTATYMPPKNLTADMPADFDQDAFSAAVVTLLMLLKPTIQANNIFALNSLLTEEEAERAMLIDRRDEAAEVAFQSEVMKRTLADGSFERNVLVPKNLHHAVPSPEQVCQWLKDGLSVDPSKPPSTKDLFDNLNDLIEQLTGN